MKRPFISRMWMPPLLAAMALLHGCGETPAETGPGGVSAEDAKQLDQAAAKLDSESLPAAEQRSGN